MFLVAVVSYSRQSKKKEREVLKRTMSSKEENDSHNEEVVKLPTPPDLKSNASYWFGAGSSRNDDIEVRVIDDSEIDALNELKRIERSRPHFIFVVDATGSMSNFTESMNNTLKQVIIVLNVLYEGKAAVSVFA